MAKAKTVKKSTVTVTTTSTTPIDRILLALTTGDKDLDESAVALNEGSNFQVVMSDAKIAPALKAKGFTPKVFSTTQEMMDVLEKDPNIDWDLVKVRLICNPKDRNAAAKPIQKHTNPIFVGPNNVSSKAERPNKTTTESAPRSKPETKPETRKKVSRTVQTTETVSEPAPDPMDNMRREPLKPATVAPVVIPPAQEHLPISMLAPANHGQVADLVIVVFAIVACVLASWSLGFLPSPFSAL